MFFMGKCVFWLSIVMMTMPGAEVELTRGAASLRGPALSGQLAGLGAACLAAPACRDAVLENAAENFMPASAPPQTTAAALAPQAKFAKLAPRTPTRAAKVAASKPPRAVAERVS